MNVRKSDRMYYFVPSGHPGEAVAYIRGENPDPEYRMLRGAVFHNWVIPHFEIGGFNETTGERTSTGILTDFLNSDLIWLIVHKRIRDVLIGLGVGPDKIQWLETCIHFEGKELPDQYFVADILDVRRAVNEQRSKYMYAGTRRSLAVVVLQKEAVEGAEIFRVREWDTRVYFSHRIQGALGEARATGVEWGCSRVD